MSGIRIFYWITTIILWIAITVYIIEIRKHRRVVIAFKKMLLEMRMILEDAMEVSEDGRQDEPTEDTGDTG